jgi:hypothetical protein
VRNLFSILLIVLLLLNVFGYYGVFLGMQYKNDLAMARKLDTEHYSDTESITIKIPIAIPYAADSKDFERVDGEFEHNGEFYRLVKRRLAQDTLYIICIRDQEHKRIHQALATFIKTFSDKTTDSQSGTRATIFFTKDYLSHSFALCNQSPGWEDNVVKESVPGTLIPAFISSIIHPPEKPDPTFLLWNLGKA